MTRTFRKESPLNGGSTGSDRPPPYGDDNLLPISALQHLVFCERQWGLIHLEQQWLDNRLTVQGRHLHEKAHQPGHETRGDLRVARGLRLCCYRLGLVGQADVVEFHRLQAGPDASVPDATDSYKVDYCPPPPAGGDNPARDDPLAFLDAAVENAEAQAEQAPSADAVIAEPDQPADPGDPPPGAASASNASGAALPGVQGLWQPYPVEYKRGKPKADDCGEVQLCAQALCLEEMLGVHIPAGALFYGRPRRRHEVVFGEQLRRRVESLAARLHELTAAGITPPARYEKKCRNCSLIDICVPHLAGGRSARAFLSNALDALREEA